MKPKKQKQGDTRKPAAQPTELTSEQKKHREELAEWNRLTKVPEFYAKLQELERVKPTPTEASTKAVHTLHDLMALEKWFARNTPYPFKVLHHSHVAAIARYACRYLRQVALCDNRDAIESLAQLTVEMTETLTELLRGQSKAAERNAKLIQDLRSKFGGDWYDIASRSNMELFRPIARELPYWPVLYSQNAAGNSHLPLLVADLQLGQGECPINVSESAKYSLATLTNARLWKCLRHFEKVHSSIRRQFEGPRVGHVTEPAKTFKEAIEPIVHFQHKGFRPGGMIPRKEIPIYRKSFSLPPLTRDKAIATKWADLAIVPLVKARFSEWIPLGKSGRPRYGDFRKQVIQQLSQIARKTDTTT